MSASQISRLCDYAAPQEGYPLIWPYNHRRVIAIRRISEKVYAKSVRRGAGNTDAGTEPERLDNFGCYRSSYWDADEQPLQAGFALPVFEKAMEMVMAGHAQKSLSEFQNSQRDKNDLFSEEFPQSSGRSATSQRNLMLTLLKSALPVGMMVANYYDGDSLTYEDLAEKADSKGTATTRVRIKFGGNVLTGAPEPVSYATKGSNDQVRVRRGVKAPEYEAEEIRNSSKAYRSSDGLPTPQSLATIYKFELDDGNILYLGVDTDNKFVELTSVTHPDEFGGRGWHTGGDIDTVDVPTDTGNQNPYLPGRPDSSGGFQAQENGPVILTNPAPDEQGFNDYILITPVADIPAIYVYLSEKGKRTKNRLPEGKNGDTGPVNEILEKRHPETNELQQLRKYDHEGKPIKDIDFGHNHGAGDPHAHDWVYPSEQAPNKIRLDGRPLRTGETIND